MKEKFKTKHAVAIGIVGIMSVTLIANSFVEKIELDKQSKKNVIVAKSDIRENTIITEDYLTYKEKPVSDVDIDSTFTNPEELIGKVSVVPIYAGEAINSKRIVEQKYQRDNRDFVYKLTEDDKALDLKTGSFVDIWAIPTGAGYERGLKPTKILPAQYVNEIKSESFVSEEEFNKPAEEGEKKSEETVFIPSYIIFNFRDSHIDFLKNINPTFYNLRLALHQDSEFAKNAKDSATTDSTEEIAENFEEFMKETEEAVKSGKKDTSKQAEPMKEEITEADAGSIAEGTQGESVTENEAGEE